MHHATCVKKKSLSSSRRRGRHRLKLRFKLFFYDDAEGRGTIEKTTPPLLAVAEASEAEAESVADAEAESVAEAEAESVAEAEDESVAEAEEESVALAEAAESVALTMSEAMTDMADMIIEVACGGVTVVVEVEDEFEDAEDEEDELLPAWLLTRLAIESGAELMKAMVGPATTALLWRSTAPPFSGWPSDVIQIATGPLMPWGTTHWPIGSGMEKGRPPTSIWQKYPCGWDGTPTHHV
jgi:hypothetical protein